MIIWKRPPPRRGAPLIQVSFNDQCVSHGSQPCLYIVLTYACVFIQTHVICAISFSISRTKRSAPCRGSGGAGRACRWGGRAMFFLHYIYIYIYIYIYTYREREMYVYITKHVSIYRSIYLSMDLSNNLNLCLMLFR